MDADEIWEEIICDSLGDMNLFASVEVLGEMNDEFLSQLKGEAYKSSKEARGPPNGSEGKASRETSDYLIYNFSGSVREENGITLSNNIKARIASAVKSGYGTLNKSHNWGRVYLSDICNCYIFSFNTDGSITVKDILNTDEDSAVISTIEEEINGNREGKRDDTALIGYIERFRNGQGYNNNNSGSDVSSHRTNGQADALYSESSNRHSGRSGGRSGEIIKHTDQLTSHIPVKQKFVDISGRHRNVLGIGAGIYMVQDTRRIKYKFNSIEDAISAENENIIQRYARKNNRSVTWVKNKLSEDSDFLVRERRKGKASRELDANHLDAANRGDMETAQRMVDEAAKRSGYDYHLYHGTDARVICCGRPFCGFYDCMEEKV